MRSNSACVQSKRNAPSAARTVSVCEKAVPRQASPPGVSIFCQRKACPQSSVC